MPDYKRAILIAKHFASSMSTTKFQDLMERNFKRLNMVTLLPVFSDHDHFQFATSVYNQTHNNNIGDKI